MQTYWVDAGHIPKEDLAMIGIVSNIGSSLTLVTGLGTSNRAELFGVILVMEQTESGIIYSDSQLTVRCGNLEWSRKANNDLWDLFNQVRRPGHILRWRPRSDLMISYADAIGRRYYAMRGKNG